ncbi:MAG: adaptor protein MecA [Vallitaleaceae bacterium]|nr:adaptor protein MecA [Vallitaleaceae bacterium]
MRIEKISSNQIKCVLDKEELLNRHINVNELAYGSEKAQELFKDMMQKASFEFGFESGNTPLMIEAVPLSSEGIMLIITKVDNPDELDDKYSGLSIPSARTFKKKEEAAEQTASEEVHPEEHHKEPSIEDEKIAAFFVYGFETLDDLTTASRFLLKYPFDQSRVYKTDSPQKYIFSMQSEGLYKSDCKVIRGILSEYGEAIHCRKSKLDFYDEHYDIVIKTQAINVLSNL